ncbi:hypothetical protein H5410_006152 [Solanum commersonii]|uniref:Uncharacterized protein n=1 Tax=Solanum commersonii TaxID=4109 RepID=A0A9J6A8D7_SOLCO|nr:hypothetical protein H5410_006152 [Solanum commersonii]
MKFIKNELRSRMNDDFLSGCMVPFMEKDVFKDVSTDDIILSFQAMKPRRILAPFFALLSILVLD